MVDETFKFKNNTLHLERCTTFLFRGIDAIVFL